MASKERRQARARTALRRLKKRYPKIATALDYSNPWQLLVSTIISAQTTDENVNRVVPELFRRWPNPAALAGAKEVHVQEVLFSTGFFR